MPPKVKIAVSVAPEVIALLDRHAEGRSRSRCVEEELLRALRAREWQRLSMQMIPEEAADQEEWAAESFAFADQELHRQEGAALQKRRRGARRARG